MKLNTEAHREIRNGWPVLVYADGRVRPIIEGGSDGDPAGDPPDPSTTAPAPPAPADPLAALQTELTRVATRESAAGRRAAERELLEAAGFQSRDEMLGAIAAARMREEAELNDAQRAQRQAEQREQAAAAREAAAAEQAHHAAVRMAIVDSGVGALIEDPEQRAQRRALVERLVDVEVGADADAIAHAIEAVRLTAPELFTAPAPAPGGGFAPPTAPSSLPRGQAPRTQPPSSKSRVDEIVEGVKARTGIR